MPCTCHVCTHYTVTTYQNAPIHQAVEMGHMMVPLQNLSFDLYGKCSYEYSFDFLPVGR